MFEVSGLPRVRTDLRHYMTTSDITMPTFQMNKVKQLDQDLYGMLYGGYLESMYAGVGGEALYRPMGERWAVIACFRSGQVGQLQQRVAFVLEWIFVLERIASVFQWLQSIGVWLWRSVRHDRR